MFEMIPWKNTFKWFLRAIKSSQELLRTIWNNTQELLRMLKSSSALFEIDILNGSFKWFSRVLEDYFAESFGMVIPNSPQELLRVPKNSSGLLK